MQSGKSIDLQQVRQFGNIEFLARQLVDGFITGLHKSPYHGFSVEFAEHKIYNPGESTRHIDWKVYAKTDKLFTKRYEEETNLRCQIVLDVSGSMQYPAENKGKLTFSIVATAALAQMLQKQRDAFGLTVFADQILASTQVKSTSMHLHKLFITLQQLLDNTPAAAQTNIANVLHDVATKINRRSLVIIFSDMLDQGFNDDLFSALQHLKHELHEVIVFHVFDKKTEEDFAFAERPYEFVDSETGEKLKLRPNQVRELVSAQMKEYRHELLVKCGQYKIDVIEADINLGIDQILLPYLAKRQKMA